MPALVSRNKSGGETLLPALITGFALVAVVLVVAGLTWGFVERAPLSFPIIPETPIINYT
jgi:hypothetical protein